MRLIDADRLYIDWYDSFQADDGTEYDNIPLVTKGQIDDAPTIEMSQWIPCSERLPEERQGVLVQYADGTMSVIQSVRLKFWNKKVFLEKSLQRRISK